MKDLEKKRDGKSIPHMISHIILSTSMIAQIIVFIFYFNYGKIPSLKIIGAGLWIISIIFGWFPIYALRTKGKVPKGKSYVRTTKLVDTGIYSIVRHPQFLAGMLWSLAFILISQHWLVLVLGIPVIIIFYLGGFDGDKSGVKKFGKKYEDYMKRVPRFNFILGIIRKLRKI
ncbi:methyltransferase family protein [[Eubacterium] cellulosolvens]